MCSWKMFSEETQWLFKTLQMLAVLQQPCMFLLCLKFAICKNNLSAKIAGFVPSGIILRAKAQEIVLSWQETISLVVIYPHAYVTSIIYSILFNIQSVTSWTTSQCGIQSLHIVTKIQANGNVISKRQYIQRYYEKTCFILKRLWCFSLQRRVGLSISPARQWREEKTTILLWKDWRKKENSLEKEVYNVKCIGLLMIKVTCYSIFDCNSSWFSKQIIILEPWNL